MGDGGKKWRLWGLYTDKSVYLFPMWKVYPGCTLAELPSRSGEGRDVSVTDNGIVALEGK